MLAFGCKGKGCCGLVQQGAAPKPLYVYTYTYIHVYTRKRIHIYTQCIAIDTAACMCMRCTRLRSGRHRRTIQLQASVSFFNAQIIELHVRIRRARRMVLHMQDATILCLAHTRAGHAQHECDDFACVKPNIGGYIYCTVAAVYSRNRCTTSESCSSFSESCSSESFRSPSFYH